MNPVPNPPEPPPVPRRVVLLPKRVAGVAFLALFPLLALTGVLANRVTSTTVEAGSLTVEMEYPSRLRYRTEQPLDVEVRNRGTEPARSARVSVNREFLSGFADAAYTPEPSRVTEEAVEFDLGIIPAGAVRRVQIELKAERYGLQRGQVRVEAGDASADLEIRTFVLP